MEPDNPIYIVSTAEQWEGSEVNGAFFNLSRAQAFANKLESTRKHDSVRISKWLDDQCLETRVAF